MNFITDFFGNWSDRAKLFLIVFISSLVTVLLSLWIGGLWATALVIVPAILLILQVTKGVWTPEGGSKSKIGIASLSVASAVVITIPKWKPLISPLLQPIFEYFPFLKDKLPSEAPTISILLFLTIVILIVNYFARDTTAMKEHSTPIEKEFPEKNYKGLLKPFTGVLLDDLNRIDRETNWSAEFFTPLDAEVEVRSGSKRLKKVTDLLSAIRSDRGSRVFLVLGDPGSGKSVALRKLCRDLLKEVDRAGKIPLYINLREWDPGKTWTEEDPPTVAELYKFVLDNLKSRGDVFTNDFLDKYFKKMFEHGRLFIVLDSFDEIPAVLDEGESSWLIDKLSELIYRFLAGAHDSRGILASRIFRRPTDKFDAKTILEIRPFTERKIVDTLKKSLSYDESLINLLFSQRQEFIPIARNPFTAALISSYAKEHNNTLPNSQAELYSSYILKRLDLCKEKITKKGLTNQKILECSIEVADIMLTTEALGLEAPLETLKNKLSEYPVEEVTDILRYARLGRLGGGDERRFSFVHRRFNEYFVVQKLKENPQRVPKDDIPTDSRWRDALVLYCEVAEESEAKKIADYCWSEISKITIQKLDMREPQFLRAIHCLRFLKDAFRARLDCINLFRDELAAFIKNQVENQDNLLFQKLAVEAVGLLSEKDIEIILIKSLEINNPWINETALKACHYLPKLSNELTKKLIIALESIGLTEFFNTRKDILFSLKLSNIFSDARRFAIFRLIDFYLFCSGLLIIIVISPLKSTIILSGILIILYIILSFLTLGNYDKNIIIRYFRNYSIIIAGLSLIEKRFKSLELNIVLLLTILILIPWYIFIYFFPYDKISISYIWNIIRASCIIQKNCRSVRLF